MSGNLRKKSCIGRRSGKWPKELASINPCFANRAFQALPSQLKVDPILFSNNFLTTPYCIHPYRKYKHQDHAMLLMFVFSAQIQYGRFNHQAYQAKIEPFFNTSLSQTMFQFWYLLTRFKQLWALLDIVIRFIGVFCLI